MNRIERGLKGTVRTINFNKVIIILGWKSSSKLVLLDYLRVCVCMCVCLSVCVGVSVSVSV